MIEHIRHHARSAIFSAAPPPSSVAAALKALELIEREPERRKRLWETTDYMKREFNSMGFDTGASASPVIPLAIGEDMDLEYVHRAAQREAGHVRAVVRVTRTRVVGEGTAQDWE